MTVYVDHSGTIDGHAYVDLGLPSGTLWAATNVGATNPEDYGLYFAWGETQGYTDDTSDGRSFDLDSYKWNNGSDNIVKLTKYCYPSDFAVFGYNGYTDDLTELETEDDAAYVNWGSNWRMPSKAQCEELINSSYTTQQTVIYPNGVIGWKITSKTNGNSISLPYAGMRSNDSLDYKNWGGCYWSRTLDDEFPSDASWLTSSNESNASAYSRDAGLPVRPVRNK